MTKTEKQKILLKAQEDFLNNPMQIKMKSNIHVKISESKNAFLR